MMGLRAGGGILWAQVDRVTLVQKRAGMLSPATSSKFSHKHCLFFSVVQKTNKPRSASLLVEPWNLPEFHWSLYNRDQKPRENGCLRVWTVRTFPQSHFPHLYVPVLHVFCSLYWSVLYTTGLCLACLQTARWHAKQESMEYKIDH